jgi:hypothetical protein
MAYQLCGVYRIHVHIINEGMDFYDFYWMHAFEHVYLSQGVGQHCNFVGRDNQIIIVNTQSTLTTLCTPI